MLERRVIEVEGTVQGVGFRPYVHRLAAERELRGFVRNDGGGVHIDVEGEPASLEAFCRALTVAPPPLSGIARLRVTRAAPLAYDAFRIAPSAALEPAPGRAGLTTPPDVATCDACLAELFDPGNRRYRHPFITCTSCGPRFTIVRGAPYDRARTAMAGFPLCDACRREYEDPGDRRFHAESIACPACGPVLAALDAAGAAVGGVAPLDAAVETLRAGGIVAVKALGGYHLACDATDAAAVARLRVRKHRPAKPFAIMVRDLQAAAALGELSDEERALLASPSRPIVLLVRGARAGVADAVAPGQPTLGVMLPSTPVHHLLLAALDRPLVMTSGNRSDEPVVIDDAAARTTLGGVADLFLTHDRPIVARCDDSVARVVAGEARLVRRSRGHVPNAIRLARAAAEPVLATGGHLKSTACVAVGRQAFFSAHVGDLDGAAARDALRDAIAATVRVAGASPHVIAHDLHPDYGSTHLAYALATEFGVERRVSVQHHHAHVAACVAEHGVLGSVIGVVFDGAGLGTDGAIWGGEFLVADGASFTRAGHLAYAPLPGGDAAARRPWRSAAAHALRAGCDAERPPEVDEREWSGVRQLLMGSAPMPRTSSVGRLFDAVASLLGVRHVAQYEGDAAVGLEAIADARAPSRYALMLRDGEPWTADPAAVIRGVIDDGRAGRPAAEIAGAFHAALRDLIVDGCERVRDETRVQTVALTGGVFMNALLLRLAHDALTARGFRVLVPRDVPCNDGGLSLGQAWVAMHALEDDAPCA